VALQIHAIAQDKYLGQDLSRHAIRIIDSSQDPLKALFKQYTYGSPSTIYHWVGGRLLNIAGPYHCLPALAWVSFFLNLLSLLACWFLIVKIINSFPLRLACLLFIAFLPALVVPATVIAADALTIPAFMASLWLCKAIFDRREKKGFYFLLAVNGLWLILAANIKFTFAALIPASALFWGIFFFKKAVSLKRFIAILLLVVILPGGVIFAQYQRYLKDQFPSLGKKNVDIFHRADMTVGSLLGVKLTDLELFSAPYFHQATVPSSPLESKRQKILENNYYSYPGLMHLALYTDIMSIYQRTDPAVATYTSENPDEYYNRYRTPWHQGLMEIAVKSGLVLTLSFIILFPIALFRIFRPNAAISLEHNACLMTLFLFATAYYLVILTHMPWIDQSYAQGYWLPRLILPVIMAYALIYFWIIDQLCEGKSAAWGKGILAVVLLQSIIHYLFLFPF